MSNLYKPERVNSGETELSLVMGQVIVFNRKGSMLRKSSLVSKFSLPTELPRSSTLMLVRKLEATVDIEKAGSVMRYVSKAKYA